METLNTATAPTGNSALDTVNDMSHQDKEDERNAVPLPGFSEAAASYAASLEDPAVKADAAGSTSGSVTLTDNDDDFLPYLQDVEENWDMREQAYQDQTAGKQRVPGEVSNEYLLPGRKTVHGLDIVTGQRILDRDTGIPAAEEAYAKGREQLKTATFNINEGYGVDGITGMSSIAEGVIQEDKGYGDFEKKIDLLGVPPEQAKLAWQTANRQVLQDLTADAIDHAIENNTDEGTTIDPPDIDMEELPEVEGWADSTKVVYEAEEGRPFEGTDDELIDWYVDQMSSFNWKIGVPGINSQGMAYYMSRAFEEDESYSEALLNMVSTYDRVNTNWDIVGRNLGQVVTDPVNLVGVPGGAAIGTKIGGAVAKKAMTKWLTARMAARGAGVGAVEGAAWAGGSEAMMQQVEQEAGRREDISYGQIAGATAIGGAIGAPLGATMGVGIPFAAQGATKAFKTMRKNARKGSLKGPLRNQIGAINPNAVAPFKTTMTSHPDVEKAASLDAAIDLADNEQFPNNRALKVALQDRVQVAAKTAGIDLSSDSPETTKFLKQMVVKDAKRALRENENAVGWYDRTVSESLDVLSLLHPEIKTDADAKFAFTYALAVTSNGLKVDKNFELAEKAYQAYKTTGKMPSDVGIGTAGGAIDKSLGEFNDWANDLGMENLRKMMESNFTVRQLKKAGFNVGGEHQDTLVRGAAILGPKIGNGFFSNLNGNFDQLTMDRWLMRTWGRMTGSLITARPDLVRAKTTALKEITSVLKADKDTVKAWKAIGVNLNERSTKKLAAQIQKASMKPENRLVMNKSGAEITRPKGDKGKTETATPGSFARRVGNGLSKDIDGQKEAPTVADRNRIRSVFTPALEELRADGHGDMTMADLQALVWYPEKRLYDKAKSAADVAEGYADDEAPDYANAAKLLARGKGFTDEQITEGVNNGLTARARPDAGTGTTPAQQGPSEGLTSPERSKFLRENVYAKGRANSSRDGKARLYSGGGGTGTAGPRGVKEVFTPTKPYAALAADSELPSPTLHELTSTPANASQYADALQSSKDASKYGASVTVHPPEAYADMRLFQTPDGGSGFAVTPDGEIVSVYSSGGGNIYGMLQLAVEQGGKKLDAVDTVLPEVYEIAGFKETGRMSWDDQYMPEDWDKSVFERYNKGEPDIVEMKYGE